jgi:membrane protease subunit HflK
MPSGNGDSGDSFENVLRRIQRRVLEFTPTSPARTAGIVTLVLFGVFCVWTAFYQVPSDSVAVVQRFGKYLVEVPPGLHAKLPLGFDVATIVPVKRQLKQEFGFNTPGASDPYQSSNGGKRDEKRETEGGEQQGHLGAVGLDRPLVEDGVLQGEGGQQRAGEQQLVHREEEDA